MDLNSLKVKEGSTHAPKRVGQGIGSGMGKTSTRGEKGQGARQGRKVPVGFEGGSLPLYRRLPKHGFVNYGRVEYYTLTLDDLDGFDANTTVDNAALMIVGLIPNLNKPVKILGDGKLTKKLNIQVQGYTKTAKAAIEANKGKADVLSLKDARLHLREMFLKALEEEESK